MNKLTLICLFFLLIACSQKKQGEVTDKKETAAYFDSSASGHTTDTATPKDSSIASSSGKIINMGNTKPADLVAYAQSLTGTPYVYGSTDPSRGFDCSGFITYVFRHFNIAVPRSSIDFTNVDREVPLREAKSGDIILFTGTDSTDSDVGHMGIITTTADTIRFIHSTSGKAMGVTTTPLNKYYMKRFVKVLRVFKQNDD
jgi:cell wall-associated NlpC family hydrolase